MRKESLSGSANQNLNVKRVKKSENDQNESHQKSYVQNGKHIRCNGFSIGNYEHESDILSEAYQN